MIADGNSLADSGQSRWTWRGPCRRPSRKEDPLPADGAPSDDILTARAREGDEEAFGILFERHAGILEARIKRLLPDRLTRKVSVADVLQETRIVAYERRQAFDHARGAFRNWPLGIADRKASEAVRKHMNAAKRAAGREITKGARASTADFVGREPTPSQAVIAAEAAVFARRAMGEIPEDYREVLRLVQAEGRSLADAAERMGRSRDAVKKLYARALARFRETFDELRGESPA